MLNVVLSESNLITRRIGSMGRDSKVSLFIAGLISLVRPPPSHCSTCTESVFAAGLDAICRFHHTGMWCTSNNVSVEVVS